MKKMSDPHKFSCRDAHVVGRLAGEYSAVLQAGGVAVRAARGDDQVLFGGIPRGILLFPF